jgi:hypothetical protein
MGKSMAKSRAADVVMEKVESFLWIKFLSITYVVCNLAWILKMLKKSLVVYLLFYGWLTGLLEVLEFPRCIVNYAVTGWGKIFNSVTALPEFNNLPIRLLNFIFNLQLRHTSSSMSYATCYSY